MEVTDPRFKATIPTTTKVPGAFRPISLNPAAWRDRETNALLIRKNDLDAQERILDERAKRLEDTGNYMSPDYATEEAEIAAKRSNIAFDRAAIDGRADEVREIYEQRQAAIPVTPTIFLKIPDSIDREQLQSKLSDMGLRQITQEAARAILIDALYDHDWGARDAVGGIDAAGNEAIAEGHAEFLDGFWQVEALEERAIAQWQEQEMERILDVSSGAPDLAAVSKPPRIQGARAKARAVLLQETMISEAPKVRRMSKMNNEFAFNHALVLIRLHVVDVDGIVLPKHLTHSPHDGTLVPEDALMFRQALEDNYGKQIGQEAWTEIIAKIDSLYTLEAFEQGNSASPSERLSDPTGSNGANGDMKASGGASKIPELDAKSSTAPLRVVESEKITDSSSASGTDSDPMMPELRGSPTDAA